MIFFSLYCLLNKKKPALKKFVPRTWCAKKTLGYRVTTGTAYCLEQKINIIHFSIKGKIFIDNVFLHFFL